MNSEEFVDKFIEIQNTGDFLKIEQFCIETRTSANEAEDYECYLLASHQLLHLYQIMGRFDELLSISDDMLLLMEELKLDEDIPFADVLTISGIALQSKQEVSAAKQNFQRAVNLYSANKENPSIYQVGAYAGLAEILNQEKDFEKSYFCYEKAYELSKLGNYGQKSLEILENNMNLVKSYL